VHDRRRRSHAERGYGRPSARRGVAPLLARRWGDLPHRREAVDRSVGPQALVQRGGASRLQSPDGRLCHPS